MSTAVSGVKPRAPKPWDKLRRHVRSPSWGAVSQPSSPGSPDGEPGPFHVLPDEKLQELDIASAGGSPPSARHSERAEGASAPAELAAQAAPARAGAASTPPSRVYARSKSSPGASSAPSDSAEPSRVSPVAKSDAFSKSDASATATATVVATTTTTSASSSPEKEKEKDKDKDKDDAFQWLLTRQLEVEMSLRGSPPATQADVEATRAVFASFCEFFDALRDGARALSDRAASGAGAKAVARTSPGVKNSRAGFLVPPEDRAVPGPACEPFALFQELLHRVAGFSTRGGAEDGGGAGDGVGSAAGTSVEVPMHQAKVLYRASVATDAVLREVDDVLGAEAVRDLVASVRRMRGVLRVKMEDANDVRMAEEAVRGARRFFDTLQRHAEQEGKSDVEVLRLLREA